MMTSLSRRTLLQASLTALAIPPTAAATANEAPSDLIAAPDNEAFWTKIAEQYDVKPGLINLENGNWGLMARPVLEAYKEHTERVNRDNSYFARREYWPLYLDILEQTATRLAATPEEIAFTRGATEALQAIIGGYNRLTADDAVMFADLDYGSVQATMRHLARKTGAQVVELEIPEPVTRDDLIRFYDEALATHPKTKLLLLTHISHRTGLCLPVREICQNAKARGVHVVVDAAHSWGQLDFTVKDLGAEFIGFNLHKWIGAPIGVGAMYIQRDCLDCIDPNLSEDDNNRERIFSRVHTGTSNFAAYMSVPDAFAFQDLMGGPAKQARLRYLRNEWVNTCLGLDNIDILTPDDERLHGGITSFRLKGHISAEQNKAIAEYLLAEHKVYTVHRTGVASGACIRVTPGYYTSLQDVRTAAGAIIDAAKHFTA